MQGESKAWRKTKVCDQYRGISLSSTSCSHENASGYYRVSVFFFSQVVTDLIAKRIAPVLLFSVITYFMLDLDREPEKFFIFLLTLFLVSISAAAITYAFSSIANVTPVATLLSALAFVLSMVGPIPMSTEYHHLSFLSLRLLVVWRVFHCPEESPGLAPVAQVPESVPLRTGGTLHQRVERTGILCRGLQFFLSLV